MKRCAHCYKRYQPQRKNSRHCSDRCKKKAHNGTAAKPCKICGKAFLRCNASQTICNSCIARMTYKGKLNLMQCHLCDAYFIAKNKNGKYCSKVCSNLSRGMRPSINIEAADYRLAYNPPSRKCACGTPTNNYRCDDCWRAIRGETEALEMVDFPGEVNAPM